MCAICLANPCNLRCPNVSETVSLFRCKVCGEGIFEGDEYFDTGNKTICGECMENMSLEEVLALFDEKMKIA